MVNYFRAAIDCYRALCDPMQYFLTSTGRAGCYVRKDKFDQRLASARSFAPRTFRGSSPPSARAIARGDRRAPPYVMAARGALALAGGTAMQRNGIHHVTAIAGPVRRNVDFYARTLGLRLVKRTVNFDDPGTYHLYYGDEQARPGTLLTFFPWER